MYSPGPSEYSPRSSASNFADDEYELSSMGSSSSTSRPASVYSYHSSVDGQLMLKDVHGRIINNTSERYGLPADPAEHARLDLQHLMLKTKMNGLFVPLLPVRRALAPRQSTTPSILDLGTGSGSWAIDMAKLFPHADVVGLDLVPANLNSEPPLNCRFECDDINLGLLHYRNAFDVVHARCIALGIEDYQKFLGEVIEVLRPGGVYLAGAGDMQLYNEDRSPVVLPDDEEDPKYSWMVRYLNAMFEAMRSQKSNINFHQHIGRWIREKGNAWDDTGEKVYWVALGPWEEDAHGRDRRASELMRQNFLGLLQSARPLILSHGYFESSVDRWIKKAQEEMNTMKRRLYVKWRFYWAIKPGSPESSSDS